MIENKKFVITESDLCKLISERNQLQRMLGNLIVMFKHEDKLKRHHRPYLHVRTEIDKVCDGYLKYLSEISRQDDLKLDISSDRNSNTVHECKPDELVGDLVTLLEYIEILRNFIGLLESGIEMEEVTEKFNRYLNAELDEMTERWEKHLSESDYESE